MEKRESGFTLVELMVSIIILSVISLAIVEVFNTAIGLWRRGNARLEMFQNARFALDKMSELIRSAIRTDEISLRQGFKGGDNPNDSSEIDRFVVVNNSSQAPSTYITDANHGFNYGYKYADGIMFIGVTYGSNYDQGDMIAFGIGMSNNTVASSYTAGEPYIWIAKTSCATDNTNSYTDPRIVRPDKGNGRPVIASTGATASTYQPYFYFINDLQFEVFDGSVASGSVNYWDSHPNAKGHLPTMVRMEIECLDPSPAKLIQPFRIWTDIQLISKSYAP